MYLNIDTDDSDLILWRAYTLQRPVEIAKANKVNYNTGYTKSRIEKIILGSEYLYSLNKYNKIFESSDLRGYYMPTL